MKTDAQWVVLLDGEREATFATYEDARNYAAWARLFFGPDDLGGHVAVERETEATR